MFAELDTCSHLLRHRLPRHSSDMSWSGQPGNVCSVLWKIQHTCCYSIQRGGKLNSRIFTHRGSDFNEQWRRKKVVWRLSEESPRELSERCKFWAKSGQHPKSMAVLSSGILPMAPSANFESSSIRKATLNVTDSAGQRLRTFAAPVRFLASSSGIPWAKKVRGRIIRPAAPFRYEKDPHRYSEDSSTGNLPVEAGIVHGNPETSLLQWL